jgi:hypothetical protein
MRYLILFLLILMPLFNAYANSNSKEVSEAKASLLGILGPILQKPVKSTIKGAWGKFSVEHCEKYKINWAEVLTFRNRPTLSYSFKPGCDIEGTIKPMLLKPFPADLKLRNLSNFTRLESENKITSTIESKPVMLLEITEANLTGKQGKVKFEADYRVRIDPINKDNPVEENLGGEIRITELYGQKVSITEKIMVDQK